MIELTGEEFDRIAKQLMDEAKASLHTDAPVEDEDHDHENSEPCPKCKFQMNLTRSRHAMEFLDAQVWGMAQGDVTLAGALASSVLYGFRLGSLASDLKRDETDAAAGSVSIFVNGRARSVEPGRLSFSRVLELAGISCPNLESAEKIYTVTFHGPGGQGTIRPGETIEVFAGIIINAVVTNHA